MQNIFSEKNRAWAYRVLLAVGLLLAGYGVVTQDQMALIIGVVGAVLNVMPTANTTTKSVSPAPTVNETLGYAPEGAVVLPKE